MEKNDGIRLNKYLSLCGIGTRRECDKKIAGGNVWMNGARVKTMGVRVNPEKDTVEYQGKVMKMKEERIGYAVYKPRGVVTTRKDRFAEKTIYDLFSDKGIDPCGLKYAGRLDKNSEGLIVMTDDGDMIHSITHPKYHIKKVYYVELDKPLPEDVRNEIMHKGVESDNLVLNTGRIKELEEREGNWYSVILYEGKKRQIRRIFRAKGLRVERLVRVKFAGIKLEGLNPGDIRKLTDSEMQALKGKGYKDKA